jgi:hypothetical protein
MRAPVERQEYLFLQRSNIPPPDEEEELIEKYVDLRR